MATIKTGPGRYYPPDIAPPSVRGRVIGYLRQGVPIMQKWPAPRKTRTPAQLAQEEEFKRLVYFQKHAPADQMWAARNIARNSKYTYRDILALAAVAKLVSYSNWDEKRDEIVAAVTFDP